MVSWYELSPRTESLYSEEIGGIKLVSTMSLCREDVARCDGACWARSKKWADALERWAQEQVHASSIRDADDRERAFEISDKRLLRARPKA